MSDVITTKTDSIVIWNDRPGYLMVCLCDIEPEDFELVSGIGGIIPCAKHANSAKLASLVKSGVRCLLNVKDENGNIIPIVAGD